MTSTFIKQLMKQTGFDWDEIIDTHVKLRKEHLDKGGKILFDTTGDEVWLDCDGSQLVSFTKSNLTD
jgi:hypothetical protein